MTVGNRAIHVRTPRAHGARPDARGGGDEVHGQLVVEHAGDQYGSTRGGGSVGDAYAA